MAQHDMDIATFKAAFDGGTRPNRFTITLPKGMTDDKKKIMVKAASIPAETIGILQVPFRGRVAKLPGDRAYAEWTCTIIDDTTKNLRSQLVNWHRLFNNHETNIVSKDVLGGGNGEEGGELSEITVTQLDMQGNPHTSVTLEQVWPVDVGAIDLSYDKADTLVEFAVTFAYDYISTSDEDPPTTPVEDPPTFG